MYHLPLVFIHTTAADRLLVVLKLFWLFWDLENECYNVRLWFLSRRSASILDYGRFERQVLILRKCLNEAVFIAHNRSLTWSLTGCKTECVSGHRTERCVLGWGCSCRSFLALASPSSRHRPLANCLGKGWFVVNVFPSGVFVVQRKRNFK